MSQVLYTPDRTGAELEAGMANAIRALAMDAVQQANSGHPGMPMGMADAATALFTRHLKFDASDPRWPDRDRFVLSAGHGSMLIYALLYLTGYERPTLDDIRRFRQLGSPCAGHPENFELPGVEVTTGPLGQGVAMAVGMAIAERHLNAVYGDELVDHRTTARAIHERLWFRPLLEAFAGTGTALSPDAAAERLAAFGFTDVERTHQAVEELTRGLTRSSRMMQQVLPLLLDWLSASPDPDLGLLGLRRLATGEQRSRALATAFRDSPEVARHLALLLGTSRRLGDVLVANPDLIERLPDPTRLVTRARDQLVASVLSSTAWRSDRSDRQQALQRWQQRNLLGIAARDVFGQAGVEVVGQDLTALAEASIEGALAAMAPQVPIAVVAFGRLGGGELGYASDLDLAFVHEGPSPADNDDAERVANGVLRLLGGDTPAERVWAVDAALRPEGRNGPVSRSLDGWRAYVDRWASTWERQAYLRLRAVAGSLELGQRLVDDVNAAIAHVRANANAFHRGWK